MGLICDWLSDTSQDDGRNFSNNLIKEETGSSQSARTISAIRGFCIGDGTTFGDYILLGFIMSIISVLGILGNTLSALVLVKSQFRSSVNLLLLGLTISDTIVILYSLATFVLPATFGYWNFGLSYNHKYFPLISPYFFPIASIGLTGSIYYCVAVTVERYVVVCWPLYAKSWCTNKRARTYSIIVTLFSILITFPKWFEIKTIKVDILSHSEKNETENDRVTSCFVLGHTPLRQNSMYQTYYVNWSYFIFMYSLPFLVLVTLNYSIYQRIKLADRRRSSLMSRGEARETSVARMLLSVVIVFLACHFLPMFNRALETFWEIKWKTLINLSNFLILFNSCCNFGIYCIFGQKFRTCFITTWNDLCPCLSINSNVLNRNNLSARSMKTETVELVQYPTTSTPNITTTTTTSTTTFKL